MEYMDYAVPGVTQDVNMWKQKITNLHSEMFDVNVQGSDRIKIQTQNTIRRMDYAQRRGNIYAKEIKVLYARA